MGLMDRIKSHPVDPDSIGIWWLGQMGMLFKTSEGRTLVVDPYLTDSAATEYPDLPVDLGRVVPIEMEPEELDVDVFASTHAHQDHADPVTISRTPKGRTAFVGPASACDIFRESGVPEENIRPISMGIELELCGIKIIGTFALPTSDDEVEHLGLVFVFPNGIRVYTTGDTGYSELLGMAARHKPDVMLACINPVFDNLGPWNAAKVAAMLKPDIAIPGHHDLFRDNREDPRMFEVSLKLLAPDVKYQKLTRFEPFIYRGRG